MPCLVMTLALMVVGCADRQPTCEAPERIGLMPPSVRESSGLAASRAREGVLWTHNDSGSDPLVFAVATDGTLIDSVRVSGALVTDWEDIAIAPCAARSDDDCLYIADVGNNRHTREAGTIYRVREPRAGDAQTLPADRLPVRYPGAGWDMEALFVLPGAELYLISKGVDHAVTLLRYPPPLRPDSLVALEPVQLLSDSAVSLPDQVTAATATRDGRWVAVRTYTALRFYRVRDGQLQAAFDSSGIDLSALAEPQGEGLGGGDDGTFYLSSERGLDTVAPLSRIVCAIE
ncbi:MAG: hypothetical protein ACRELD_07265 [Longimicrobiales bacterium]